MAKLATFVWCHMNETLRRLSQRLPTWLVGVACLSVSCLLVQAETRSSTITKSLSSQAEQQVPIITKARSITTKAAEIRLLGSYARINSACAGIEPPPMYIEEPPVHGIVCLRRRSFVLKTVYGDRFSYCLGREAHGIAVVYLARKDYAGADAIRYSVRFPFATVSVAVSISVSPADTDSPLKMPADISDPEAQTMPTQGPIPWCTPVVS